MLLEQNLLQLDIKLQDRYRELISKLGKDGVELKCIVLGDSDIDYELSLDMNNARILNAPYNVGGIKYPLIYNGIGKGLAGTVTVFVREIDSDSKVSSLYTYPTNKTFAIGYLPPTLENGYDWDKLTFTNEKMGFILFYQTLLDYYLDENGLQQRFKEEYDFEIMFNDSITIPTGWEIIIDRENGSLLIGKGAVDVISSSSFDGLITATGKNSSNKKIIEFNF